MPRLLPPLIGVFRGALDELCPDALRQADDTAEAPHEPWRPDDPERYCPRCGASAGPGAVTARGCAFCLNQRLHWQRITRLGPYSTPLDERVRRMKFQGQWRWAQWMGEALAEVVDAPFDASRFVVCPVPMHWTRRWRRGFNQSALMADRLAKRRGWRTAALLRRARATPPQTAVAPSSRGANVRGAFALACAADLSGHEVLLVDDVKTSGATLSTCARLLRRAGAQQVRVAVAAVADPRGADFKAV